MNLLEKKENVINTLGSITDEAIIDEIYDILHPEKTIASIAVNQLSEPLQKKINKALNDFSSGNYILNDDMKRKTEQWLTK